MTIRRDALTGMLRLETAAADWFRRLSDVERTSYLRAHPGSKYARHIQPASPGVTPHVDTREGAKPGNGPVPMPHTRDGRHQTHTPEVGNLLYGISRSLVHIQPKLTYDPAHARFFHKIAKLADQGSNATEAHPHHLRSIKRLLTKANREGIPNTVPGAIEHNETHGEAAGDALEAAKMMLHQRDTGYHALAHKLRSVTDHLRIANHLQKGNIKSAVAHASTLPSGSLPKTVTRHLMKHADARGKSLLRAATKPAV